MSLAINEVYINAKPRITKALKANPLVTPASSSNEPGSSPGNGASTLSGECSDPTNTFKLSVPSQEKEKKSRKKQTNFSNPTSEKGLEFEGGSFC